MFFCKQDSLSTLRFVFITNLCNKKNLTYLCMKHNTYTILIFYGDVNKKEANDEHINTEIQTLVSDRFFVYILNSISFQTSLLLLFCVLKD